MRTLILLSMSVLLLLGGCGVNKTYVSEQIAASEAKTGADVQSVQAKADANAAELAKLQSLSQQLSDKADMALNKASGFEKYQAVWTGEIHFAFDSYDLDGIAASVLDEAGAKMEKVPYALIEITGHTDRTGSAGYNLQLGQKRSDAAKRYLADKYGVPLFRMFTNSFGKEKPIALPDEKNAGSKNRRVVLTIWALPQ